MIGKFKDETDGVPIVEFCGLRSKMYSIKLDNGKEKRLEKEFRKMHWRRKFVMKIIYNVYFQMEHQLFLVYSIKNVKQGN